MKTDARPLPLSRYEAAEDEMRSRHDGEVDEKPTALLGAPHLRMVRNAASPQFMHGDLQPMHEGSHGQEADRLPEQIPPTQRRYEAAEDAMKEEAERIKNEWRQRTPAERAMQQFLDAMADVRRRVAMGDHDEEIEGDFR